MGIIKSIKSVFVKKVDTSNETPAAVKIAYAFTTKTKAAQIVTDAQTPKAQ